MNSQEKSSVDKEEDIVEVDVEDLEEEDTNSSLKESLEVDPETKEIEEVKNELLELIEKEKVDDVLDKFVEVFLNLKTERKKKEEYLNTAQIVQADFENYKKRVHKDQEWSNFQNKQKILQKFLTLYEDIERTVEMFKNHPDTKSVKEAVELIYSNLNLVFESLDIQIINPQDEQFNPQYHEAIYVIEDGKKEKNNIVEVISKGFQLGNIILKPARVVISKEPSIEEREK